jgi:hypothetical protein
MCYVIIVLQKFMKKKISGNAHKLYILSNGWISSVSPPPPSSPHQPAKSSGRRQTGRLKKRDNLLTEEGGGGVEAKSYDREKACASINHSVYYWLGPWGS